MFKPSKIMPKLVDRRHKIHYLTALNLLSGVGVDISRVKLLAVGTNRNYRGEIQYQEPEPGTTLADNTPIVLKIGCSSAIDFMPYQFFYGLQGIRSTGDKWETDARRLLAPFDANVIRYQAVAQLNRLKYKFGLIRPQHLKKILDLFDFNLLDDIDDQEELLFWLSSLPMIYRWGGNPEILSTVLHKIFGYRFTITENVEHETTIPNSIHYKLGTKIGRLGFESILGKSFKEYDSTYELIIEDISPENIKDLLPGGKTGKRLERILDYCMPGELDRKIKLRVDHHPEQTPRAENQYLGYATYI